MEKLGEKEVETVNIDNMVVQAIAKHAFETNGKDNPVGYLFGYYDMKTLELNVTHAIPQPDIPEDEKKDYKKMIKKSLKDLNYESKLIGWFNISQSGHYLLRDIIKETIKLQSRKPGAVLLHYDITEAQRGSKCPLKAYRVTHSFVKLSVELTEEMASASQTIDPVNVIINKIKSFNLALDKIFIPISTKVTASPISQLFSFGAMPKLRQHARKTLKPISAQAESLSENLGESLDFLMQNALKMRKTLERKQKVADAAYKEECFLQFLDAYSSQQKALLITDKINQMTDSLIKTANFTEGLIGQANFYLSKQRTSQEEQVMFKYEKIYVNKLLIFLLDFDKFTLNLLAILVLINNKKTHKTNLMLNRSQDLKFPIIKYYFHGPWQCQVV